MKTTPNYGWPYPESGDHTRTWEYWQNLATAADASVKTIDTRTADSGNKDAITFTPAAGFGTIGVTGRRFGGLCVIHWTATRTGAVIAAVATGNIADTLVLTITDPSFQPHFSVYSGFGVNIGSAGRCFLGTPAGTLYISQYAPGVAINTNDILTGSFAYIGGP